MHTPDANWHRAYDLNYVGRNSTATAFFAFAWDGITTRGNRDVVVPDGDYVIKLEIQKALGDENNPAHWETWTSPVITIARP
jgi:minor extracellular serine protease Vpr